VHLYGYEGYETKIQLDAYSVILLMKENIMDIKIKGKRGVFLTRLRKLL